MAMVQVVKEEIIGQQVTSQQDDHQMTLPQSSSIIECWKPLETKKTPLLTRKRPSAPTHETKQVVSDDPGKFKSYKRKKAIIDQSSDRVKVKPHIMEQAQEIQANLAVEFPSLVKLMLPSHVTFGFWLGLPKRFCVMHLPSIDTKVVLEDESGVEYETKYLAEKVGLSAGWRGFSIAHKLLEGDVVVFHLVTPSKFKVYIVRSNCLDEVDGALGLLKLEACTERMDFENDSKMCEAAEEKCLEPLPLDIPQEYTQKNNQIEVNAKIGPISDQSENDSEDPGSEVLEGIRFSESVVDFKEVNRIENFTILVNGLIIDSEFSKYIQTKYYELCCSQKSFLHEHLVEGINCKLAAGIISETINIADAIRASKITTSQDFAIWDKTLKAFEELGMNVGFLRARLERLSSLAFESKKCREASTERVVQADEMIKTLHAKLLEVRESAKKFDAEIEDLKVNNERIELTFQEEANAPW